MVRAKKHFGQHFLHDKNIIEKILNLLEDQAGDRFLEIGPGPATLTKPLNARGHQITAIEVDKDMVTFLNEQTFDPPVTVIHDDLLKIDLSPHFLQQTKVLSNLPYNVSVPITGKLLHFAPSIPLMVLMYQKEVAQRIQAKPNTKDFGPISVLTQCFYNIETWFDLGPGAFKPPPKVVSRVLKLVRKPTPLISTDDIPKGRALLNLLFGQRRKMVKGVLKKSEKETWIRVYDEIGNPTARPENLSPEFYAEWIHREKEINHD